VKTPDRILRARAGSTRIAECAADANPSHWEHDTDPDDARLRLASLFVPALVIEGHHYDLEAVD
jgi:hypothetical protein